MHNDSRMITKYIVEATTEALMLCLVFGISGLSIYLCVEDYLRSKRLRGRKGR